MTTSHSVLGRVLEASYSAVWAPPYDAPTIVYQLPSSVALALEKQGITFGDLRWRQLFVQYPLDSL